MNFRVLRWAVAMALLAATQLAQAAISPGIPTNPPNLIAPPSVVRPLKVAIYDGPGSGEKGIVTVTQRIQQLPGARVTALKPDQIGTHNLGEFDIVVFSGGSGSAQAKAIGEAGRKNVRAFVEGGGGYLGICAGAYLACAGFEWGLGILNAKTVSQKWQRGRGMMLMELTDEGRAVFGPLRGRFNVRYANGPIINPLGREGLPPYHVAALFRTEISSNGTPVGVMIDSPAVVCAPFGKGRVLTISPHSEDTPGLENFVPRALAWLGEK